MKGAVPAAVTVKLAAVPAAALCTAGATVADSRVAPVALKLCLIMFERTKVGRTWPPCVACSVMTPAERGLTVKTPPTGRLIEAEPVEPATTVSTIGKVELATGVTVNETPTLWSGMAAKLIDWAPAASGAPATNS